MCGWQGLQERLVIWRTGSVRCPSPRGCWLCSRRCTARSAAAASLPDGAFWCQSRRRCSYHSQRLSEPAHTTRKEAKTRFLKITEENTKLSPSWHRSCEPRPPAAVFHRCARPVQPLCSLYRSHWRRFWPFCRKDRCSWKISQHSSDSPFPGRPDQKARDQRLNSPDFHQHQYIPAQINLFRHEQSTGNNQICTWTYWTQAGLDRAVVDDVEFPILKTETLKN